LLERGKEIRELYTQVPFTFRSGVVYIADFVYLDIRTNRWVAEDSKGAKTAAYIIKKKMFIDEYPQFVFIES